MTFKEVNTMISGFGLPYAYYQFPNDTPQSPPFICFYYDSSSDLYADNLNYQHITELTIEFYSDEKDFTTESSIESALNAAGLTYRKYEQYIDEEHMHETVYEMEVLINAE